MKNNLPSVQRTNGLVRINSDADLEKNNLKCRDFREMRQMKSANKCSDIQRKQFCFQDREKIIGNYKFDTHKEIGQGYSSKVYKATSLKDNQIYAVKVMELRKFKKSQLQFIQNQIKILKKSSHPNIVQFKTEYKSQNHRYLITEFCSKGDLLNYITRHGRLQQKQALEIFRDLVKGLQYLIKNSIIHRDIKPGNILFDGKTWKIADFGFAIEVIGEIKTDNNVGTPLYMPLETLQKNIYSPESDIFALGIVLYELLVGITPWECRSQKQLLKKLKTLPLKIPNNIQISNQTKQLLIKICNNDKNKRLSKRQFLDMNPDDFGNQNSNGLFLKNLNPEEGKYVAQEGLVLKQSIKVTKQKPSVNLVSVKEKNIDLNSEKNLLLKNKSRQSAEKMEKGRLSSKIVRMKSTQNILQIKEIAKKEKTSYSYSKGGIQKRNKKTLIGIVNFCRYMFYLAQNAQQLHINDLNRQKLKIILYKHALLILNRLTSKQKNWFGLESFELYCQCKSFKNLEASFHEYLVRYQLQYQQEEKKSNTSLLKEINDRIPEFWYEEYFEMGEIFYQKVLGQITPIIRQNNHNLALQLIGQKKTAQQIRGKVEAIKTLYKYFKILQAFSKETNYFKFFQDQNTLEVLKNYNKSSATLDQFIQLRKQIKYV